MQYYVKMVKNKTIYITTSHLQEKKSRPVVKVCTTIFRSKVFKRRSKLLSLKGCLSKIVRFAG